MGKKRKQENGKGLVVSLNGKTYSVTIPPDHATRWDLAGMVNNNAVRGSAAVLGVCCPDLGMPGLNVYGYNVGAYSTEVIDRLNAMGIRPDTFVAAATPVAVEILRLLLPSESEVIERVDFTSPAAPQK